MKFLIVSLRYLGDCLLAAALAPALKARFPDAQIDMLTFKDNAPILEGVQDISHVIGVEHHPNKFVQEPPCILEQIRLGIHYYE